MTFQYVLHTVLAVIYFLHSWANVIDVSCRPWNVIIIRVFINTQHVLTIGLLSSHCSVLRLYLASVFHLHACLIASVSESRRG